MRSRVQSPIVAPIVFFMTVFLTVILLMIATRIRLVFTLSMEPNENELFNALDDIFIPFYDDSCEYPVLALDETISRLQGFTDTHIDNHAYIAVCGRIHEGQFDIAKGDELRIMGRGQYYLEGDDFTDEFYDIGERYWLTGKLERIDATTWPNYASYSRSTFGILETTPVLILSDMVLHDRITGITLAHDQFTTFVPVNSEDLLVDKILVTD